MKTNVTYIVNIGLHILLGIIIFLFEPLAKLYFLSILVIFLYRTIMCDNNQRVIECLKACAYFVGAEVFFRMTKGSISYEASKYLVILFSMIGIFYKGISGRAYPYFLYLMFLVPSIFVASTTLSYDAHFRTNIAFVLSGPVCLGMAALFTYEKRITYQQILSLLWAMLYPIITTTAYLYFYNPSVKEVISNTASNVAASGGFGPNQVATVLGLGMFLVTARFFLKSPELHQKIFNLLLFVAISFRALVTFSRGGVIAAAIVTSVFLFFYFQYANRRRQGEIVVLSFVFLMSIGLAWGVSSSQTGGYIDLRYANKDHMGREKEDMSTGRTELFIEEIEGFVENPFFGIGSSRSKDQRIEEEGQGIVSHNEVSRTLAEHGIFGVAILVILIVMPLALRGRNKSNIFFYSFLAFWFATINHSGMRIAAPAFVYALALLNVTYEKSPVHRKQLKVKGL